MWVTCPRCKGSGIDPDEHDECLECQGDGGIEGEEPDPDDPSTLDDVDVKDED